MGGELVLIAMFLGVIVWAWRVVTWVWLSPNKIEKMLREQGLSGTRYRLLYGDTKEIKHMAKLANSNPINLCDDFVPRVIPFYHHVIKAYGKSSFCWMGPIARVIIMEPELIQEILTNNRDFKKPTPKPLAKFLVCGLTGCEDEKWSKHRKIINPAFYVEKLKNMLPAMCLSSGEMMKEWEILIDGNSSAVCELNVQPYIEGLMSDVISRTAFGSSSYIEGRKIHRLQKEQAQLTIEIVQSVYIPGWRFLPTRRNMRLKEINSQLKRLFTDIIKRKEYTMNVGEDDNGDNLLSLLMRSNKNEIQENGDNINLGMNTSEIIEECKTFYFAGQESTSNLVIWTMIMLSIHSNWQVRAREEVLQVFGTQKPDYDGLSRLKIVTMILYEVLRLFPPSTIFTRVIYKDTKLGKMALPPGVQFLLPVLLVHHDTEIWGEDAKEFKPDRFSQGISKATNNRLSFFPFSWGPRICIGNNFAMLEAKLVIAMMLQRFSFELSPAYTHAPSFALTLQPQYGAHLLLRKI
ncbi:Secologanin synthase [Heracleum sosnowskyi]|uniref:Secologanin synthase n=1 Tax=Heracleum sosnowskyi TaxID=360622 RepID=A0AAD8J7N5_9APIA|nr:Secologanin synthase [Heracleum sosnowskyi]